MSSERITEAGSPEEMFLARLADVAPVAEATEQVHLAAALAAVREAEVAATGRRTALRPTVPLWRKPRMALSNVAAIIAGLSLPLKAAAASTVAVAAIGGAAVTGNLPTQAENANDGLSNATEQSGVTVPADGQPESRPVGEGEDIEAQENEGEENENKGVDEAVRAVEPKDRGATASAAGQAKAAEASDGRSAAAREAAAEAAAENRRDAEARKAAAQERRDADADARAEAEARADAERSDAQTRRQQARDNAPTSDATTTDDTDTEADADATSDDAAGDASTGAAAGAGGRAKADAARGR